MAIRSPFDLIAWTIGRLPFIALAVALVWISMQGLTYLEMYSFGTEFFVSNNATSNVMPMPRSDTDILLEAYGSGDVEAMEDALAKVERRHAVS